MLPDNGVLYICTTSTDFPENDSFTFLEELQQAFNSKNNNLYSVVEEVPADEVDAINVHPDDIESVTVVDGMGVKKIRKLSGVVKKKMVRLINHRCYNHFLIRDTSFQNFFS